MKQFILSLTVVTCLILASTNVMGQSDAFCTSMNSYVKLAPLNFKAIQGERNEEASEEEGEDVFDATELLAGFETGHILPTFTEGKLKLQFYSHIADQGEADEFLAQQKAELDACLTKAGFKYREDSGIHFYETSTVTVQLMRSTDFDDNGDDIYKVLVQMNKR